MTIKELETLVGMTRANIRFYEQQGLISPMRQPNGYRDYSQEDADILSKIKLFRQPYLDLAPIHALQSEELTPPKALENNSWRWSPTNPPWIGRGMSVRSCGRAEPAT